MKDRAPGRTPSWRALVPGIIASAITTAVVALIVAAIAYATDSFGKFFRYTVMRDILDHVAVEMEIGKPLFHKENGSFDRWSYTANCKPKELLVGGSCITTEDGHIQSQGSIERTDDGSKHYVCTYNRHDNPEGVRAVIVAACLKYSP